MLLGQPQRFALDEPWTGLDTSAHGVLAEIIAGVSQADGSVVFTSHGESDGSVYPSRIYRIEDGRVSVSASEGDTAISTVEVLLAPRVGCRQDIDWYAHSGVGWLRRHHHGSVTAESSDALLEAALQYGWSVHEVRRGSPRREAPASSHRSVHSGP